MSLRLPQSLPLRRSLTALSALLALYSATSSGTAHAQGAQVKPYFLVIFDTSGSMADPPDLTNTCGYLSGGRTVGRKVDAAKCALGKLVNGTGDADFGLMQFAQTVNGMGQCNGGGCAPVASSALLRVPIESNTALSISALIDNTGASFTEELCSGGYTPLGGTLVAAKDYFEGNLNYEGNASADPAPTASDSALRCRPLSVILLTDGVECCGNCDASMAQYNTGCPNANADITAAGLSACPSGNPAGCGFWGGCGNDNTVADHDAYESAPEKAWLLRENTTVPSASGNVAKEVRTYVIGFGITAPDDRIERIAIGGGTDNPSDGSGGLRAFYASNEAALSLAFSQIIADSQPPAEICNNEDDDCDGLIDEGIPKFCNKPEGIDSPDDCTGDDLRCCEEPDEQLCDGIDDDCDGVLDEGTMNACGACGEEAPQEVCDGFDNDCDGNVDEGLDGGACGSDEGECKAGELRCVGGMLECRGVVGPEPEQCNGKDDDCDGTIDEDPTGVICPDGRCVAGECQPFCDPSEFAPTCGAEREPETQPNGECLCVIDNCPADCGEQTQEDSDGEVLCAPDDESVAACFCRAGACTYRCDGVMCIDGEVCDPRRGRCVIDNCRGLGCEDGQLCDATTGECVADRCATADCDDDEVCREGRCERSCADISCPRGQSCSRGECRDDACSTVTCAENKVCDDDTQSCVDNPCRTVLCGPGLACNTHDGECDRDPCFGVHCPSGQGCRSGECAALSSGGHPNPPGKNLLATGGGGCTCSALGAPQHRSSGGALLLGFALAIAATARTRARRMRTAASRARSRALLACLALVAIAWTLTLGGCEVSPYCLGCVNGSTTDGGGGLSGVGGNGGTNGGGSGGMGGGMGGSGGDGSIDEDGGPDAMTDGCVELPEECNGMDDDCDLRVDEQTEALVNDCEQRGLCGGTEPVCISGQFDCQYPAGFEADQETKCDGVDEDCDGRVDEAFEGLGNSCTLGVGACATDGELECNGAATGVVCVIGETREPEDEVCDGVDNDCDGLADEPEGEPGMNPSFVHDTFVQVSASLWMYKYEASHPDADDDSQGVISERACSNEDVLPWTNVTYDEAKDACEAAGFSLCTEAQWIDACNADGNACAWGFTPAAGSCSTYPSNGMGACNGHDVTAMPGDPDTDALAPTGDFESCFASQMDAGKIFDLSGNAKEWVTDDPAIPATDGDLPSGSNPHRGGSFNNLPGGMRCDFSFAAGNNGVRLRNLGFRCCTDEEP